MCDKVRFGEATLVKKCFEGKEVHVKWQSIFFIDNVVIFSFRILILLHFVFPISNDPREFPL